LDTEQQQALVTYLWNPRGDLSQATMLWGFLHSYWRPLVDVQLHSMFFTLQFACYCVLVLRQIRDHNKRLQRHFSSLEHMNLRWLRALTIACLVFLSILLLFNRVPLLLYEYFDPKTPLANVHALLLVVLFYVVAISALLQPSLISGVIQAQGSEPVWEKAQEPRPTPVVAKGSGQTTSESSPAEVADERAERGGKYHRSRLSVEDTQRYKITLMEVIQEQELYLDCDLTLPDLAKATGLTAPQISQVLNGQMNQNFFSFVNNYRIQLARRMLLDPETSDMPIVELAVEVGSKSKSSFYDAFKRATNMTPTQFKLAMEESPGSDSNTP
jgi:AraC-like DNA-binding protein